jgi:hypothetical protein
MEERHFERKLIRYMRDAGIYCVHMDTDVPGFPDIFATYNGKVALIEVKDYGRGRGPKTLFESTQPQMYYKLNNTGVKTFIARCNDRMVHLGLIIFQNVIDIDILDIDNCPYPEAGRMIIREVFS